jgi:hypothetical protein
MASDKADLAEILARLENAERQYRNLKRGGMVAALLVAMVFIMGQAKPDRTLEAENFLLRDHSGNMRAQLTMDASGTPALEFFDEAGERSAQYRSGDLMLFGKEGYAWLSKNHFMISTPEGHIDLQRHPLGLHISDTRKNGFGYVSLGMASALKQEGAIGPELVLFGNYGQGFAQLDTAEGPARLHLEPGTWNGKLLPGGFVDITSEGPLIQVSDREGFTTGIGQFELKEKQTGKMLKTGTASIVLAGKDKVIWSAP